MSFQSAPAESAQLCGADGESVVLQSVKATGHLSGLVLSMTLRQVFRNDQTENLEVTYTFPLPWGAVLTGLEVELAGKRMKGQVHARAEAREQYEKAIEKGDAPVMVEKSQRGLFTASLGSLKPGEEAVVEIRYAQLLSFEQGRVRLVVPTTIAPRYGSATEQGGMLPHQVAQADSRVEHAFGLELRLSGPVAHAHISCPTHPVSQQRVQGRVNELAAAQGEAIGATRDTRDIHDPRDEVRVELRGSHWLDRDFVLLMDGLQGHTLAVAGADEVSGPGHQALILSACPQLPDARSTPSSLPAPLSPLALKILVDCSGSMAGDSIDQAKKAILGLARALQETDRFTFSRFGSEVEHLLEATQADALGVKYLIRACNQVAADMSGTEIHSAMADTFKLNLSRGSSRGSHVTGPRSQDTDLGNDILLITDGEVWDVQRLIDQAAASEHRVYAIGVGSAPAESLLREMAESSGGAAEFVTPGEDMVHAVHRMIRRMRSVRAVSARLNSERAPLWCSALPRRLSGDETVHVHLRLDQPLKTTPHLEIDGVVTEGRPLEHTAITHIPGDLVARLVAARQLGTLSTEKDMQSLALSYQLVSDHTNLLLIHERAEAEKTDGMPALHAVRPMVAAGWGGYGSVSKTSSVGSMYEGLTVPSVWRRRTLPCILPQQLSIPMAEVEVPSFLRRQAEISTGVSEVSPSYKSQSLTAKILEWIKPEKEVLPPLTTESLELWGPRVIQAFNRATREGLSFRQVLQPVVRLRGDQGLMVLLYEVGQLVGGSQAAWACFLLWLHDRGGDGQALSDAALELVRCKAGELSAEQRLAAERRLDEAKSAAVA